MNQLYKPTVDGYCGDEDNGQTSAWYVFSAMGFYPVCPATNQYVFGTPYFKKTTLTFDSGKQLIIEAPANSDANQYVQSLLFNGKPYLKNWITHEEITKGGTMMFDMKSTPSKTRGVTEDAFPFSYSK